jgi:hypothetical protein
MRNVVKMGAVLVAAAMLFTGCGDPLVPLTEEEESIVVNYSAGTLAKHNSYQQEGMTAIYPEEEEELEDTEESQETEEPDDTKGQEEDKKDKPQETEDKPEDKSEDALTQEETKQLTLTEALSVPGIEFSYHDYSTALNYKQGEALSMDASAGNVLLMLNVNMTNTGSKAAECDLLSKQPTFTLSLNGEAGVPNQMTMLTNDLCTYKGTMDPGQTEAMILMFEVPEKTAENISSLQLSVKLAGKDNEIILK